MGRTRNARLAWWWPRPRCHGCFGWLLPIRHNLPCCLWCLWWSLWSSRNEKKCHARVYGHVESLAQRTQEKSISNQRGEDYASDNFQNDFNTGELLVCQRQATTKEREQNDLGTKERSS